VNGYSPQPRYVLLTHGAPTLITQGRAPGDVVEPLLLLVLVFTLAATSKPPVPQPSTHRSSTSTTISTATMSSTATTTTTIQRARRAARVRSAPVAPPAATSAARGPATVATRIRHLDRLERAASRQSARGERRRRRAERRAQSNVRRGRSADAGTRELDADGQRRAAGAAGVPLAHRRGSGPGRDQRRQRCELQLTSTYQGATTWQLTPRRKAIRGWSRPRHALALYFALLPYVVITKWRLSVAQPTVRSCARARRARDVLDRLPLAVRAQRGPSAPRPPARSRRQRLARRPGRGTAAVPAGQRPPATRRGERRGFGARCGPVRGSAWSLPAKPQPTPPAHERVPLVLTQMSPLA